MKLPTLVLSFLCLTLLTACKKAEMSEYSLPKTDEAQAARRYEKLDGSAHSPEAATAQALQWQTPQGWQTLAPSALRLASFSVRGEEGKQLDIAISTFPGKTGDLLANINRWRGQIGLQPTDDSQLAQLSIPITIDGQDALLIDLVSESQRTLVATLHYAGESWFFKLTGDRSLAEEQFPNFITFLDSIRLPR